MQGFTQTLELLWCRPLSEHDERRVAGNHSHDTENQQADTKQNRDEAEQAPKNIGGQARAASQKSLASENAVVVT